MIDLRSDTVTKPTAGMLEAMMSAQVGDDVFGEDPTVNALEKKAADLFGMESALFCPSGTMTNQIALRVHTQPQDEIICDSLSHIYRYEGGGISYNSLCSVRLLEGDRGRITAAHIEQNINPDDIHFPRTSLVSLENTMNKGGGCCYEFNDLEEISRTCQNHGLGLHLDGARLFNAMVAKNEKPSQYGKIFDSISICLSKGLGAPVGSLLLGKTDFIKSAKRVRKVYGGGMRQAGFLAAAGIYALDNHISRLKEDHDRAQSLGDILKESSYVSEVMPIETNIVIFKVNNDIDVSVVNSMLGEMGLKAIVFGKKEIRLVTHLDFKDDDLNKAYEILKDLKLEQVF